MPDLFTEINRPIRHNCITETRHCAYCAVARGMDFDPIQLKDSMNYPYSETKRIEFLIRRDGLEPTRSWVERTLRIYREAVENPKNHASKTEYKLIFQRAIKEFSDWLGEQDKQRNSRQEFFQIHS